MDTIGLYVSMASGVLLTISEILPYIKTIKSNGIIQCIIETVTKNQENRDESNPLLDNAIRLDNLTKQINVLQEQMNILQKQRLVISEITDKKLTIMIEHMVV